MHGSRSKWELYKLSLYRALYAFQYKARMAVANFYCRWFLCPSDGKKVPENPQKVLFVLTGLIGDSVMCTPVLMVARRLWPSAHITLIGQRRNCDLLAACPYIDVLLEASAIPFFLRHWRKVSAFRKEIEKQRFEIAIILLGGEFSYFLAKAGVPIRVSGKKGPLSGCLTHTYEEGEPRTWGPEQKLGALRCLGHEILEPPVPQLWVHPEARKTASEKLLQAGVARPYVVLHPFGSEFRQWWRLDQWES